MRNSMIIKNPVYVSTKGGTINSFLGDSGLLFRVCSNYLCFYTNDLLSAKAQLDEMETRQYIANQENTPTSKNRGKAFRNLVEAAAAPYLTHNFIE